VHATIISARFINGYCLVSRIIKIQWNFSLRLRPPPLFSWLFLLSLTRPLSEWQNLN
jgi:hypothetical protein